MVQEIVDGHEGPNDRDLLSAARKTFASLIELGQRLGRLESVPEADWADDLEDASWQLASRSPSSVLDQYSILAATTRGERLDRIDILLHEVYADLELMGGLDSSS